MPNLLEKLQKEALDFMDKRLRIEDSLKRDLANEMEDTIREIKHYISSIGGINIFYLNFIVQNELRNIIEAHKNNSIQLMNDSVNNSFEVGINQASKFLAMTEENFNPIIVEQNKNQEVLAALLLYAKSLVNGLYDDMLSILDKDLTSSFILARNQNSQFNKEDRNTDNDTTLNTVLTGAVLVKYLNDNSFRNIANRSDTISQTESNRALNHGILLMYISAKKEIQELKVQWVEVKDNRLCKYCQERASGGPDGDGVYSIGEISPPPLHPNCRCVLIPFLYKWFIK